jgi:hypothetical protein
VTVQDNATTVTHVVATGAVTFFHAGITYTGTVKAADSTFTTPARAVNVNDGFNYSIGLAGRFTANAFDADATVDRTTQQGGSPCQFIVHWAGTR